MNQVNRLTIRAKRGATEVVVDITITEQGALTPDEAVDMKRSIGDGVMHVLQRTPHLYAPLVSQQISGI